MKDTTGAPSNQNKPKGSTDSAHDRKNVCRSRCEKILQKNDLMTCSHQWDLLDQHLHIIREINHVVQVVSHQDMDLLFDNHTVDSLSLASILYERFGAKGHLLDIGTGGGFPAVPLRVALPEWKMTWIERSTRKAGVLRRIIGALHLEDVDLLCDEFDAHIPYGSYTAITARAVEQPERLLKGLAKCIEKGAIFLGQAPALMNLFEKEFHVEQIDDEWTQQKLRRGRLYLVQRRLEETS